MTLQEATDHISMIMGHRSDIDAKVKKALQVSKEFFELGPTYPWFLLSEVSTFEMSVNAQRVPVPADFLNEYEEGSFYITTTDEDGNDVEIYLVKADLDELKGIYGSSIGKPAGYSLDGRYFRIFPTPDEAYPLKMIYYKKDIEIRDMSASDTNQWLTNAPYCLIGHAGQALSFGYRDGNALQQFKIMESQGTQKLYNQNEGRRHAQRTYQIGGAAV